MHAQYFNAVKNQLRLYRVFKTLKIGFDCVARDTGIKC